MNDNSRHLKRAIRILEKRDPVFAEALGQVGYPEPRVRDEGFPALLRIIVGQQISNQAGNAIWNKLELRAKFITPDKIIRMRHKTLQECGLSRQKVRYAKALARSVNRSELKLSSLREQTDHDVRDALIQVDGIGLWTAEIYLMFSLGRPDIFPIGDLALSISAQKLFKLAKRPTGKELKTLAERWKPWRTAAALFLWHYYSKMSIEGRGVQN